MVERLPSLAVRLRQAEGALREHLRPVLDELALSLDQWRIIAILHDDPGLGMTTLASAAVVPNATLTRLVDDLAERGIVVRRLDPEDKRRVVAALSRLGTRLARRLRHAEDLYADAAAAETLGQPLLSGRRQPSRE